MGNQSSKNKEHNTQLRPPLPKSSPNRKNPDSEAQHEATPEVDLSSYEAACREDPQLRSLDADLQKRASQAINSVAVGLDVGTFSLDSLREVTECLLEMNQEVVNIILQSKKDIWKNPELFDLVNDYFENSLQSLDFCAALEACLKRAIRSQSILLIALQRFDDENENPEKTNLQYTKTLEELRNFKAAADPFTEEFFSVFQGVYKQQITMLEKLQTKKNKLDKKLGNVQAWKKVTNAIFVVAFVSVLICSVVAAAVTAPPVVTALAAAAAVPLGTMGKWLSFIWSKWEKDLKGQKEIILSMEVGSFVAIKDMDNIRVLVEKLEIEMKAMAENAEFGLKEEEEEGGEAAAVRIAVMEIKKKVDGFMKTLQDLSECSDKYSRDINRTRAVILRKIIKYPSSSEDQGNGNMLFSS